MGRLGGRAGTVVGDSCAGNSGVSPKTYCSSSTFEYRCSVYIVVLVSPGVKYKRLLCMVVVPVNNCLNPPFL